MTVTAVEQSIDAPKGEKQPFAPDQASIDTGYQTQSDWARPARQLATDSVAPLIAIVTFSIMVQYKAFELRPLYAATTLLVSSAIVLSGTLVMQLAGEKQLGYALFLGGSLWSFQWLGSWNVSVLPFAGAEGNALFYIALGWGLLRYPSHLQWTRRECMCALALTVMIALQAAIMLTSTAQQSGFDASVFWPRWTVSNSTHHLIFESAYIYEVLLAIGFALTIRARIRRMTGIDQLVSKPLAYGFGAVALVSGISETTHSFPPAVPDSYYFYISLLNFCVPLGFFFAVLKHRLHHASVADSLHSRLASGNNAVQSVELALQDALNDQSLEILYWSPDAKTYVRGDGQEAKPASSVPLRAVQTNDGAPLAMIYGDESLRSHTDVLGTAINASAMALENAQLHANVLSQLEEVRNSRERIAEAAIVERKRIERDLHDGVQQRLLALATRVGTAATSPDTSALDLEWMRNDLLSIIAEVRNLAQGIHPAELRQFGISAAIRTVADSLALDIEFDSSDQRFHETVEATAYFVVCEALSNIVKHANATRANVVMKVEGSALLVVISDNGDGGASFRAGGGLRGLSDRVSAVRGTLNILPNRPHGTVVRAEIPCA